MKKRRSRKEIAQYLFLVPGLAFWTFAIAIPFLMGIKIAFTDWNGINPTYNYVGFKNFIAAFHDMRLGVPARNTILYTLLGVVGNTVIALGLALLVNRKITGVTTAARTIFFAPVCFSAILTAFIWGFIYRVAVPNIIGGKNLLGNATWVIPSIIVMELWNQCGINMLIYLSGLKNIPTDLYEAAIMDGAGVLQRFRFITLPLLMPSFTICITLCITNFMKEFALPLTATGGGPAGASRSIAIYIYENLYQYNKAGYGQAISIMFVIVLVIVAYTVEGFFRRREVEL